MTKKKLWSVTRIKNPMHARLTVRVGEYTPGGTLHAFYWRNGKQVSRSLRCRRVDLGATTKAQVQEPRRLGALFIEGLAAAPLATDPSSPNAARGQPLTVSALADRCERDGFAGRTPGYRRDAAIRSPVQMN
jgi:hypothetical protein